MVPARKAVDQYRETIKALLDDLAALHAESQQQREALRETDQRMRGLRSLADKLIALMPLSDQAEWQKRIADIEGPVRIDMDAGTPAYRGMLRLIQSRPEKDWRADELESELERQGLSPKTKTIYNALNRLEAKGALVKIRRGVYRVRGYGFGIVTSDNLDGTE